MCECQGNPLARVTLPYLLVNRAYVGMSRDMEKQLPQLYYKKMKLSFDLSFLAIRVAIAR